MRRSIAAALAASLLTGVAACSSAAHPTAPTIAPDSGTLTVVAYKGGGTQLANLPQINAAFQAAYPNIKLNFTFVDANSYPKEVTAQLAAGTAADVLMVDKPAMIKWQPRGYLADLSDQPWAEHLSPSLTPFNSVGPKTYVQTSEVIPVSMFTNTELLRKAGISHTPQTWPEFVSDLQTLKDKNMGGLLLADKGGWTGEQLFLDLGANLITGQWAAGYDSGSNHWSGTWAPIVDKIKELLDKRLIDGKQMLSLDPNTDGVPMFESGKYAFTIQGAWNLAEFTKNAKFPFTMDPFPGGADGSTPRAFTFIGTGWGINSGAKNRTAAQTYLDFLAQPAQESLYLKGEAAFSSFFDIPSPSVPQAAPIAHAFTYGFTTPSAVEVLNYGSGEARIQAQVARLLNDPSVSTDSVLAALDHDIPATPIG